ISRGGVAQSLEVVLGQSRSPALDAGGNSLVKPIPSLGGRKTFIKKLRKPYRMAMRKKRANSSIRRKFFGRNPRRAALTLRIKYVKARLCYLLHRPGAHTTSTQIAIRLACV